MATRLTPCTLEARSARRGDDPITESQPPSPTPESPAPRHQHSPTHPARVTPLITPVPTCQQSPRVLRSHPTISKYTPSRTPGANHTHLLVCVPRGESRPVPSSSSIAQPTRPNAPNHRSPNPSPLPPLLYPQYSTQWLNPRTSRTHQSVIVPA